MSAFRHGEPSPGSLLVDGGPPLRIGVEVRMAQLIQALGERGLGGDGGLDRAGAVLYWSAGAAELFGLGRGEVLRRAASGLPFWSPP